MDLDGRVVIVTGAGNGIGRADALLLAGLGARVVVNDLGSTTDGAASDTHAADAVVDEIRGRGGVAVANHDDVSDWDGARRMVAGAVETFGVLHGLVNNAGILRNRMLFNMTEDEWDVVMAVNARGSFAPMRWATGYWREQRKAGNDLRPAVVNTVSHAGILGSPGGTNYAASKGAGIALTVSAARELQEQRVRVNAVAPAARSRLTLQAPGSQVLPPDDPDAFDPFDPANVAPLVAYLLAPECPFSGGVFAMLGDTVAVYGGWEVMGSAELGRRWTVDELAETLPRLAEGRDLQRLSVNAADPVLSRQVAAGARRRAALSACSGGAAHGPAGDERS